jgi:hypothetical protein
MSLDSLLERDMLNAIGTSELGSTFSSRIDDEGCMVDGNITVVYWYSQHGGHAVIQHCLPESWFFYLLPNNAINRRRLIATGDLRRWPICQQKGAASNVQQMSVFGSPSRSLARW